MKRSEMLQLIKAQWQNSTSFPSDDAVAKYILDAVEKAGMMPPKTSFISPEDEWGPAYKHYTNAWEKE